MPNMTNYTEFQKDTRLIENEKDNEQQTAEKYISSETDNAQQPYSDLIPGEFYKNFPLLLEDSNTQDLDNYLSWLGYLNQAAKESIVLTYVLRRKQQELSEWLRKRARITNEYSGEKTNSIYAINNSVDPSASTTNAIIKPIQESPISKYEASVDNSGELRFFNPERLLAILQGQVVRGPLNLNPWTKLLQEIVMRLLSEGDEEQSCPFETKEFIFETNWALEEFYIIDKTNKLGKINLSQLINEADFSQLSFEHDIILKYERYLQENHSELLESIKSVSNLTEPFKSLPPGLVWALILYTKNNEFNDYIHRRKKFDPDGLKLEKEFLFTPGSQHKYLLLSICMAAAGLNRLPCIYSKVISEITEKLVKAGIFAEIAVKLANATIIKKATAQLKMKHIKQAREKEIISSDEAILLKTFFVVDKPVYNMGVLRMESAIVKQACVKKIITDEEAVILQTFIIMENSALVREDRMTWFRCEGRSLVKQPSFFSTSYDHVAANLQGGPNVYVVNPPAFMPTLNPIAYHVYTKDEKEISEKEVLFAPSQQMLIEKQLTGASSESVASEYFVAFVRSPVKLGLSYGVGEALRFAFKTHLKWPYKEEISSIICATGIINRPNHGLVHTTCKLFYVDPVIKYFAEFNNDLEMRSYCKQITATEMEYIQIALAFSVTGRESEVSIKDDPEKYLRYKRQSAENFKKYAEAIGLNEEWIFRLARLIYHLSNPEFIKNINVPGKDKYQVKDTFIFHIMTLAHNLGLMRCMPRAQYLEALKPYYSSSAMSEESKRKFGQLGEYATACIRMTGNQLMCFWSGSEVQDCDLPYFLRTFAEMSASPSDCEKFLRQVPKPGLFKESVYRSVSLGLFFEPPPMPPRSSLKPIGSSGWSAQDDVSKAQFGSSV